jgi:hypothetical protein
MKFIFFVAVATLFVLAGFSQSIFRPDYIEGDFISGFIFKNYPQFPERKNPPMLAGVHVGIKWRGEKFWHRYYRHPEFGALVVYGSLGNKQVLGNMLGVLPEMYFTGKLGGKFNVLLTLGLGAAYFNKPFDSETNTTNTLIGSHIAFFAYASPGLSYNIHPNSLLLFRVSSYHSSNSHVQLPNIGANILAAEIGVRYNLRHDLPVKKEPSDFVTDKKFHFNIRLGYGINQRGGTTDYVGDKHFHIYMLQLYFSHNYHEITRYHIGLQAYYNEGYYQSILDSNFYVSGQRWKASTLSFLLGHEFLLGHFSLYTQGGVYLHNPYFRDVQNNEHTTSLLQRCKSLFFGRLGFNYYLKNAVLAEGHQFFIGTYIKTNFSQADFFETGVGYTF